MLYPYMIADGTADGTVHCAICQEGHPMNDIHVTGCNHTLCMTCFNRLLSGRTLRCPLCRAEIKRYSFRSKTYRIQTHIVLEEGEEGEEGEEVVVNNSTSRIIPLVVLFLGDILFFTLYFVERQKVTECRDNLINYPV
jgi:hypothetical protein